MSMIRIPRVKLSGTGVAALAVAGTFAAMAGFSAVAPNGAATAAAAEVPASASMGSHEQRMADVRAADDRVQARLDELGVNGTQRMAATAAANPGGDLARELAKAAGEQMFGKIVPVGLDAFLPLIFGTGPDPLSVQISELADSVEAVHTRVDQLAAQVDRMHTERTFINAHGDAMTAASLIKGSADLVAYWESRGEPMPASDVATVGTSWDAIYALDTLMTDTTSGAIPAMLELGSSVNEVSNGDEYWDGAMEYIESIRAIEALAVMNLAYLADEDDDHRGRLATGHAQAKSTIEGMFELTGAPYPVAPGYERGTGFLHATGEDWALVAPDRPTLQDEEPAEMVASKDVTTTLKTFRTSWTRYDEDQSLQAYATANGIPTTHYRPDTVATHNEYTFPSCWYWADHKNGRFVNDHVGDGIQRFYDRTVFGVCTQKQKNKRDAAAAKKREELEAKRNTFVIPVETNGAGWAARTDEEAIRGLVEGLQDFTIDRGEGAGVSASFATGPYDYVQVVDPATGDVLESIDVGRPGSTALELDGAAVKLKIGYRDPAAGEVMDARATSTLTANLGEDTIELDSLSWTS